MFKYSLACLALLATGCLSTTTTSRPGYSRNITSTVTDPSFSFGKHYAVLNLDLIDGLVANVNTTRSGQLWIDNVANWIDAYVLFDLEELRIHYTEYLCRKVCTSRTLPP